MRKRNRFLLLCCLSLFVILFVHAQEIIPPDDALAADESQNELYTSAITTRTTTYYDLGCKHQGLGGYFAPDRWSKTIDFGDGGVDVTEAPNSKVVEGATGDRLIVQTESSDRYTWRITVPADGYLYFRLEKFGSFLSQRISSTDTDLQLFHNDKLLTYKPLSNGGYYSPHLKAGDIFAVAFKGKEQKYEWGSFTFYSNCVGVIVNATGRLDPKTGLPLADNVKPIMRAEIDQLFFPSNLPEVWPVLDQDGDFATVDDQIELNRDRSDEQPIEVSTKDRVEKKEGQYWICRRFTFKEPCSGNTVSVDRKWQPLPLLPAFVEPDLK